MLLRTYFCLILFNPVYSPGKKNRKNPKKNRKKFKKIKKLKIFETISGALARSLINLLQNRKGGGLTPFLRVRPFFKIVGAQPSTCRAR